jgi:hypothetical protein
MPNIHRLSLVTPCKRTPRENEPVETPNDGSTEMCVSDPTTLPTTERHDIGTPVLHDVLQSLEVREDGSPDCDGNRH